MNKYLSAKLRSTLRLLGGLPDSTTSCEVISELGFMSTEFSIAAPTITWLLGRTDGSTALSKSADARMTPATSGLETSEPNVLATNPCIERKSFLIFSNDLPLA